MKSNILGKWLLWTLVASFIGGFIEGYEGYATGLSMLMLMIGYTFIVPAIWLAIRAIKENK